MEKKCISCGMPLLGPSDHAAGDESKDYCVYCANPDGSMKSYEEVLDSMAEFVSHTRHLPPDEARAAAAAELAQQPAWQDR